MEKSNTQDLNTRSKIQSIKKTSAQKDQPIINSTPTYAYCETPDYDDDLPFDLGTFTFDLRESSNAICVFELEDELPTAFSDNHTRQLTQLVAEGHGAAFVQQSKQMVECMTYAAAISQVVNTTPLDIAQTIPEMAKLKKFTPVLPRTICSLLHTLGDVHSTMGHFSIKNRWQLLTSYIRKAILIGYNIMADKVFDDTSFEPGGALQNALFQRALMRNGLFWSDHIKNELLTTCREDYQSIVAANPTVQLVNGVNTRLWFYDWDDALNLYRAGNYHQQARAFGFGPDVMRDLELLLQYFVAPTYMIARRYLNMLNKTLFPQNFTVSRAIKMILNAQYYYATKFKYVVTTVLQCQEFSPTMSGNPCQLVAFLGAHTFEAPMPLSVSDSTLGYTYDFNRSTKIRHYLGYTSKNMTGLFCESSLIL